MVTRRSFATGLLAAISTGARAQGRDKRLCVFGIGGTSNAIGAGDPGKSPKVPPAVLAYDVRNRKIVPGNDPLPQSGGTGSPWPAFGAAFNSATGMNVMLVQCAGGGYQTAKLWSRDKRGEHWDVGGSRVSLMFLALDDALKEAKRAGYDARLSGVLWCHGETEGAAFFHIPDFLTPDEYKAVFRTMVERFRRYYSPTLPFYIFRTGSPDPKGPAAAIEPGYAMVRAAQEELARTLPNVIIASRLAVQFAQRGQLLADILYNQDANNELGRNGASNVAASKLWNVW
jgi:hypothetical protein